MERPCPEAAHKDLLASGHWVTVATLRMASLRVACGPDKEKDVLFFEDSKDFDKLGATAPSVDATHKSLGRHSTFGFGSWAGS